MSNRFVENYPTVIPQDNDMIMLIQKGMLGLAKFSNLGDGDLRIEMRNARQGEATLLDNLIKIKELIGVLQNNYTKEEIDQKFKDIIGGAPDLLDTLKELSKAVNDNPNFGTTILTMLGNKADKADGKSLISDEEWNSLKSTVNTLLNTLNTSSGDKTLIEIESTGYGVISGLTVSAQSTPNMTVNVAPGIVHMVNGVRLAPIGNNVLAISVSDTTNARKDIIYVHSDSSIKYLAGIPASTPVAPVLPESAFLLAEINVATNATTITNTNITDKRKIKNTTDLLAASLSDIIQDRIYYCGTTSGTNTYTANNSKITAYTEGLTVRVKIGVASTGASTLNINELGAKAILDSLGNQITSGGLKAGLPYQLCYNGANFILLGKGGGGNLTSDKLLNGYTATGDSGQIVGTMPNNGATNKNLSINETYVIPKGYHDGSGKVTQSIAFWNPSYGEHWEATNITVGAYSYGNGANYAYMRIPGNGNYINGVNWVMHYEPQLLAQNIVSGATIFGVGGNAQKLYSASGTATSFNENNHTYINIASNINFTPKYILGYYTINYVGISGTHYFTFSYHPDGYWIGTIFHEKGQNGNATSSSDFQYVLYLSNNPYGIQFNLSKLLIKEATNQAYSTSTVSWYAYN